MAALELQDGEELIDNWTLNLIPPDDSRYTGTLYVTNQRLLFEAKFDNSTLNLLGPIKVNGDMLVLEKSNIRSIEKQTGFFKKKIIVELEDGQACTFDYGMLSVDSLYDAVSQ